MVGLAIFFSLIFSLIFYGFIKKGFIELIVCLYLIFLCLISIFLFLQKILLLSNILIFIEFSFNLYLEVIVQFLFLFIVFLFFLVTSLFFLYWPFIKEVIENELLLFVEKFIIFKKEYNVCLKYVIYFLYFFIICNIYLFIKFSIIILTVFELIFSIDIEILDWVPWWIYLILFNEFINVIYVISKIIVEENYICLILFWYFDLIFNIAKLLFNIGFGYIKIILISILLCIPLFFLFYLSFLYSIMADLLAVCFIFYFVILYGIIFFLDFLVDYKKKFK